jgi:hypothetical protein
LWKRVEVGKVSKLISRLFGADKGRKAKSLIEIVGSNFYLIFTHLITFTHENLLPKGEVREAEGKCFSAIFLGISF